MMAQRTKSAPIALVSEELFMNKGDDLETEEVGLEELDDEGDDDADSVFPKVC